MTALFLRDSARRCTLCNSRTWLAHKPTICAYCGIKPNEDSLQTQATLPATQVSTTTPKRATALLLQPLESKNAKN